MVRLRILIFLCLFSMGSSLYILGQSSGVRAIEGSFGVDSTLKVIVWHENNIDSVALASRGTKSFFFDQKFDIIDAPVKLSYVTPVKLKGAKDVYTLYITKYPLIHLSVAEEVEDDIKILGYFTYFNEKKYRKSIIGIEHRGNLSLTFPKKSFDLEFWSDSTSKKSRDIKFKGLRNDDDWILDGLYNEPLRIRSTLAAKLWLDIHSPSYLNKEPRAKSGFDVQYVEVFKNGQYLGIYALSESVDRKQLALKTADNTMVRGELFKATAYEGAPSFKKAPAYDNVFPHWGGFEMKFPILDYKSNWGNLARFVNFVVYGSDEEFALKIGEYINMDNLIDYYLFVNFLRATDNLGKNYYLARYDQGYPYFFIPWDLDGVLGIIQDGKQISTTDDLLSNGLFDKLLKTDPDGFKTKLKLRWNVLRKSEFSDSALFKKIEKNYLRLKEEKIYERERLAWSGKSDKKEDFDYLNAWLRNRLAYLDAHFESL